MATAAWPELRLTDEEIASVRRRLPGLTRAAESGCVEWTGNRFAPGYGSIKQRGRRMLAHRVAYAALVGPIPENMTLDHLCRNRSCVNVEHLEVTSAGENMLRGTSPTAVNKRKTHCHRGHELTDGNLVARPSGKRTCLTCHRAATRTAARRWRAKPGNLERHAKKEAARRAAKKGPVMKKDSRLPVRQGDVLCLPIPEMPPASALMPAPKSEGPGILIAVGESSNHSHRLFGRGAKLAQFRDTARVARVLVVGRDGAELRVVGGGAGGVDRHTPVRLAPGAYEVRTQRQYTVEDELQSRAVAD